MKIEAIDFYYLAMPEIQEISDSSQNVLLVRIQAGQYVGWGEAEGSPLANITAGVCPKSHVALHSVSESVLGQKVDDVQDIQRINDLVRERSLWLLQADHALSGVDIALWDLLGKRLSEPVYRLLGYQRAYPKIPYASQLFGDTPQETYQKARRVQAEGYRATKFGWGPFGKTTPEADREHLMAAREGLGPEGILLIDAGTVWKDDLAAAEKRLDALKEARATWLEEPFYSGALKQYKKLSARASPVKLAGGEGCHNFYQAQHMIDYGGVGFIQIDACAIGGITVAKAVADYARRRRVSYVNHTFSTHVGLSASMQPFAGSEKDTLCEYPVEQKPVSYQLVVDRIQRDAQGMVRAPEKPGLGVTPNPDTMKRYLVDAEIRVRGEVLYKTPPVKA